MTSETAPDVAKLAAELWGGREANALINARVRKLTAGSMTDWGMSGDQPRPKVTPISLAGGIPDAATQPREALIHAMERALDTPTTHRWSTAARTATNRCGPRWARSSRAITRPLSGQTAMC